MESKSEINILIIEDSEEYANYIRMLLKRVSSRYTIHLSFTLKEGLVTLNNTDIIDLVLMDLGLPDNDGFEGISEVLKFNPNLPIIILTNLDDETIGIEAIKKGASDYLTKKIVEPQLLHRMILYSIERQHILKELEENKKKLLRVQKMESIVNLAGGIAHDFNNIITLVKGYSELIMSHDDTTPAIENYVKQIQNASDRAATLIDQLSTFSQVESSLAELIDINKLIQKKYDLFTSLARNDITIDLDLSKNLPQISINPDNLEQILMNIILNSREAISSTGQVTIRTAFHTNCMHCKTHNEVICLEVEDSGSGIAEDNLPYIFDPYFTTKKEGTGLGLATVYGLAKQANGCVNVDSTVGKGTTITLSFPPAVEESKKPVVASATSPTNIDSASLLIVDDEVEILELMNDILSSEGYHVNTANSAQEALDKLGNGSVSPELIISDVVMPHLTGLDLVEKVKESYPTIPIVLMSGYSPKYYETLKDTDIKLIKKPFSKIQMLNFINQTLSSQ